MSDKNPRKILAVATNHDALDDSDRKTGLWLGELTHFHEVVSEAGFELDVVSPKGGHVPLDERSLGAAGGARRSNRAFMADPRLRDKLETSLRPDQVSPDDYEAIFIAGGHGAMWDLRGNPEVARLAESIDRRGGIVAAVCHGPAALIDLKRPDGSNLIEGQPVTAYSNVEERVGGTKGNVPYLLEDELAGHGGVYRRGRIPFAARVEVGDRLVTGQNPMSSKGVARAVLELVAKSDADG